MHRWMRSFKYTHSGFTTSMLSAIMHECTVYFDVFHFICHVCDIEYDRRYFVYPNNRCIEDYFELELEIWKTDGKINHKK